MSRHGKSARTLLGLVGSHRRPAKARLLVETVIARLAARLPIDASIVDLLDAGPVISALSRPDLDHRGQAFIAAIEEADGLVIGCPVFQGSYPGLFKHVFDLVHPLALRNRPVLITAVGGGLRHSLVVEHQLRPLFGFFEAATVSTALYACADELVGGDLPELLERRMSNAVAQFASALGNPANAVSFAARRDHEAHHAWF